MSDLAARVDHAVGKVEAIIMAVVGRVASWIAPIPVAVMTARAITAIFDLSPMWGYVTSAALELVGMSTTALWLDLKDFNRTKRKTDPEAGATLALVAMIAYFAVDLGIIAAITVKEVQDTGDWSYLIAFLFPVMSGVGVLVLNQRVQHYRRLAQIDASNAERRAQRTHKRASSAVQPEQETQAAKPADALPAYVCEECDQVFASSAKYAAHMRWSHPKRANGNGTHPQRERVEEVG